MNELVTALMVLAAACAFSVFFQIPRMIMIANLKSKKLILAMGGMDFLLFICIFSAIWFSR